MLGGGEAFPTIANAYKLGRIFGVPYVPLVAYGLPVPLPAKIDISFDAAELADSWVADSRDKISGPLQAVGQRTHRFNGIA